MARKLKISLASSLINQPVLASIMLDGQFLMSGISVNTTSSNYSTYEFDISSGTHVLAIRMDNDSMASSITDLNLVVGPIQLSKLDGTYHENLYIIPSPENNLNTNDNPELLVTRVLFTAGDELEFSFDTENPIFFRDYEKPMPLNPDFEALTGQTPSQWVNGQILIYDELKYEYVEGQATDQNPNTRGTWILLT